jgi:hypothetical protein
LLPRLRCGSTCHRATGKHWQGWNNALNQFNAGVSLQSLMALPGHVSATMSLRYGRLFDGPGEPNTRALTAAKDHLGSLPAEPSGANLAADHRRRLENKYSSATVPNRPRLAG